MAAAKKPPPHPPPILKPWGIGVGGGSRRAGERGLEELREKLMGHLREAADRMELAASASSPSAPAPPEEDPPPPPRPHPSPPAPPPSSAARPWNLRARRGGGAAAAAERRRRRAEMTEGTGWEVAGEGRRARFSVELTAEEIEADIYALTLSRPRRRPRKRPRIVQRQLDSLFPGMWLAEVSADLYKVPDE